MMKRFVIYCFRASLAAVFAFILISAVSSKSHAVKWLFFQTNTNSDGHTIQAIENSLSKGETGGLLIVGSSVCKNAINPELLSELSHIKVHQLCTGGQSIQGALALAEHVSKKLHPDLVMLDLYPRISEEHVIEGCMRVLLAAPDSRTEFATFNALRIAKDWNIYYLWARGWVASWFGLNPFDEQFSIPGFGCEMNLPKMPNIEHRKTIHVNDQTLHLLREWTAQNPQLQLVINLPPRHGASIERFFDQTMLTLPPIHMPDSCFFDTHHMRCECSDAYTQLLSQSLRPYCQE